MTIAVISMIREPWGGSEELWYQMAKQALKNGHKVIHLSYENPVRHFKINELIKEGLIEYTRPGWIPDDSAGIKKMIYIGLNYLRKKITDPLKQILKHNPDVVLYNGTAYSIVYEYSLLKLIRRPFSFRFYILAHFNNDTVRDLTDEQASSVRKAYKRANKVFFVSKRTIQTAEKHLGYTIPNAVIVRNPVNMKQTGIMEFPGLIDGNIQMALVGNLVIAHKGQDILFHVLSSEKWKQRNWTLNIYGEGKDKKYLTKLSQESGLEKNIRFHGRTNDIRGIWQINQMLLMPSVMEGMPIAIVEAMLCGRTCMATDVGGITEWITDNETGFIAPYVTPNCIDEAMERAWQKKDEWPSMGKKAYHRAIELYDPEPGSTLLKLITE
jgi:glycosyltransferase involved in cell wall biosynthesis